MSTPTPGESPVVSLAEPTPLLRHLAGDFAPRIAALWPSPHLDFLTAPAARRHLVCLGLAVGREPDGRVLTERWSRAARVAIGEPPPGLARAVERLGEAAWPAEAYQALLRQLARPRAAKLLHHADAIDIAVVRQLDELPAAMGSGGLLVGKLNAGAVRILDEAYAALRHRVGQAAAEEAVVGWAEAQSLRALFDRVKFDLMAEPAASPYPGTARLRPLATKAEIWDAAQRYRNCLATRARYAATGWSAYYEWEGPPGAIVEISRDHLYGWFLDEARIARNAPVPEAMRDEIAAELGLMGVHVGRSGRRWSRCSTRGSAPAMPTRRRPPMSLRRSARTEARRAGKVPLVVTSRPHPLTNSADSVRRLLLRQPVL